MFTFIFTKLCIFFTHEFFDPYIKVLVKCAKTIIYEFLKCTTAREYSGKKHFVLSPHCIAYTKIYANIITCFHFMLSNKTRTEALPLTTRI